MYDSTLFVTSHFVYWALRHLSVPLFSWWNFSTLILIDRGKVKSRSWVAAFCFAFVSKQMHSCHSRSHWRLLSNVIASKLIPMDARLQIQLFQVSVKKMLQRGACSGSFKYMNLNIERGTDITIHVRHSKSNTIHLVFMGFSAVSSTMKEHFVPTLPEIIMYSVYEVIFSVSCYFSSRTYIKIACCVTWLLVCIHISIKSCVFYPLLVKAVQPGSLNFVQQNVSEKSIKSDLVFAFVIFGINQLMALYGFAIVHPLVLLRAIMAFQSHAAVTPGYKHIGSE